MNRLTRIPVTVSAIALLVGMSVAEARMYRYTDDSGRTVISNTVPHSASKRGYQILNDQGRVIDTVAPPPTAEEIAAREAEKRRQEAAARQRELDQQLLKRYSHPDDAVRAMHRKMQEVESLNQLKRGNIALVMTQLKNEQGHAADLERSGQKVPDPTLKKIDRLQGQINDIENDIASQNANVEKLRQDYLRDIERLEKITGKSHTIPIEKPDTDENKAD